MFILQPHVRAIGSGEEFHVKEALANVERPARRVDPPFELGWDVP